MGGLTGKMRVLVVSSIYPPDIGGPATHAADVVEELSLRGHEVRVLALGDVRWPRSGGDEVRVPRRWPWGIRMSVLMAWLVWLGRWQDVIYATGLGFAAVVGGRICRVPVVLKVVGDPVWERARRKGWTDLGLEEFERTGRWKGGLRMGTIRFMRDYAARRADELIVPSEYLRAVVENWSRGIRDVHVIPNGVRRKCVGAREVRRVGTGESARLQVLFVGRLIRHKRVALVLEAVARVPAVDLHIVGEGPEQGSLVEEIRNLGLEDRVYLWGRLPQEDVFATMRSSDVLINVSEYEGLPHVAIEALSCGTPVVGSDVGGMQEVIQDGVNGLLLSEVTAETVASAWNDLLTKNGLLDGLTENAERSASRWDFRRTVDAIEDVFRDVA